MSEESALAHVLTVFGQGERDNVRLALVDGGVEKVSDLKELTFGDFSQLECTQPAALDAEVGVSKHLNILQRRKLLLIPLWHQEQDVHEPSTWFSLTPETFNTWRKDRVDEATTGYTVASRHEHQDISCSVFPQRCETQRR
jgi:hypothetical protein